MIKSLAVATLGGSNVEETLIIRVIAYSCYITSACFFGVCHSRDTLTVKVYIFSQHVSNIFCPGLENSIHSMIRQKSLIYETKQFDTKADT